MPVAPPPPPPPGPPPPPTAALPAAADPKGRDLLLKSIRAGTTLKKTVTKDRSAPLISGKTSNNNNNNNNNTNGPTNTNRPTIQSGSATIARTNGLGALFADGIPKLKPTRTNIGQQNQSSSLTSLPTANVSSLHGNNNHVAKSVEIIRKNTGTKNRGPPPQPPPPLAQKPVLPTSVSESTLTPSGNVISNHTRSQSTVSLQNGRVKPGLLPKPPAPAPPPPNKRGGGVSRAHSMRASGSPQMLQGVPVFPTGGAGSLKGAPMFHASTDSLIRGGMRPKPPLKAPTSRPPPPPRTAVPPPPPPIQPPPPPPLPPHRAAPPLPVTQPPPLPTRISSMRNGTTPGEFEARYIFHSVKDFPAPPPFRNVNKIYNSKTVKAHAPAPPAVLPQLQLNSKLYSRDSSNC
ncbi:hypothetical protein O3M35_012582 [Rhynocoris fuscipes]|uniref:WH2 domain-containing protein n=1 Tax=Rhynocoris fuscipes TaxID=488301 RepID=A0AAW1CUC2_9HEMI